ncbi:Crp/Fnr family transcriptional regulator [Taibaiella koreensis]|uniref:Crp/Fnr family transcriptional regulator n=1 Tax=Taibaiella koreensis TaxID=1268548 RepID=UPI000E59EA1D|nr:Crp/Fnr family transcriptional regulator [Taibaiella koreensis]
MLHTNPTFLSYIETLYRQQEDPPDIVLKTFTRGDMLLRQGSRPPGIYIIRQGVTKCYFSEDNGKDYVVAFLGAGEIAGELELIRNTTCLCTIEALTSVEAYAIRSPYFRTLLDKDPVLNRILLEELADRLVNTASRASFQQLYTMEHGLKKLLAFRDRQHVDLSKEDMAAYLGITLRSLNRLLKEMQP